MPNYEKLSPEISERIREDIEKGTRPDFAAKSALAVRRNPLYDRDITLSPSLAFIELIRKRQLNPISIASPSCLQIISSISFPFTDDEEIVSILLSAVSFT